MRAKRNFIVGQQHWVKLNCNYVILKDIHSEELSCNVCVYYFYIIS